MLHYKRLCCLLVPLGGAVYLGACINEGAWMEIQFTLPRNKVLSAARVRENTAGLALVLLSDAALASVGKEKRDGVWLKEEAREFASLHSSSVEGITSVKVSPN